MRHLPALFAALLLPVAQPLLLGTAVSTGTLLVFKAPALAENAEGFAKIAQSITVRIEGATQGSGVLVKRDGNRYTVLTAWHVVSGQKRGEELVVITADGIKHDAKIISHGDVLDLAELQFVTRKSYSLATIGAQSGNPELKAMVTVAGYPIQKEFKISRGEMYGFATNPRARKGGYTLQYWVRTEEGMSGGPLLLPDGTMVGIHGESDISLGQDLQRRNALAIPIAFYVIAKGVGGLSSDRLAFASELPTTSALDYSVAGYRSQSEGQYQKAIDLFGSAIMLEPNWGKHWGDRGIARAMNGEYAFAIQDLTKAIELVIAGRQDHLSRTRNGNSLLSSLYVARAKCWHAIGNKQNSESDLLQACRLAGSQSDRSQSCV